MSKIAMGLLVTLSINLFLLFGQLAAEEVNPSAHIFAKDGTLLSAPDAGSGVLSEDVTTSLPDSGASVSPTTGNVFTDPFTSIKGWLLDSAGGKYLVGFLFAVPNFLKAMALPGDFAAGISFLWYGFNLMLIMLFLWGDRN